MKKYILFLFIFSQNIIFSQEKNIPNKNFSIDDFFKIVRENHPIAKQATLLNEQTKAQIRLAKGGFDPKISSDWQAKAFDEKNYFRTQEYALKLPTWYGIELKGAYKTANGDFLNPEQKVPKIGQGVLGFSAPLLQGMMIDERRATLFQARVAAKMNDNDRQILMNDLLNDAAKVYWEWYFAARQITIFEQAVTLSKVRLEGLKESFRRGDKPAVDTLEAFIQYQERLFDLNDAQLSLQNETLRLNNFLWSAEQRPMQLAKNTMPATLVSNVDLPQNDAQWLESHQLLLQYEYKLNQLDIERRLKREKLKPKLNVDYNLLGNGTDFLANALLQNYRYGVSFSFPILLRQERGNLQLTDLKITNTTLQLQNKRLELQNKINNYRNDFEINQKQITLSQSVLKSYENLLAAENQKFNLGESSVFLVNARERKLIETVVKLLKLEVQQQKNYYGFLGVAGQLR